MFSARAVYKTNNGKGVLDQVQRWQRERRSRRSEWTTGALADEIDSASPALWADQFGNAQHSPGRTDVAPGGATKAAAVAQAARALHDADIERSSDITVEKSKDARRALLGVPGIGFATTNYFFILLGRPGVKPDRMIHRFIKAALRSERRLSDREAERLITEAAAEFGVAPEALDHAIWAWESKKSQS